MLRTACQHIHQLEEAGLLPTFKKLSANVSAIQLNQIDFVENLQRIIRESFIDPHHFGIEFTEGTLIKRIEDTVQKMLALRASGIHFSIDDFGTGYSSLACLNRFPIETLIDQTFV